MGRRSHPIRQSLTRTPTLLSRGLFDYSVQSSDHSILMFIIVHQAQGAHVRAEHVRQVLRFQGAAQVRGDQSGAREVPAHESVPRRGRAAGVPELSLHLPDRRDARGAQPLRVARGPHRRPREAARRRAAKALRRGGRAGEGFRARR